LAGRRHSSLARRKWIIVGIGYLTAAALCATSAVLNRELVESVAGGAISLGMGLAALNRSGPRVAERPAA
jgi:hypothetical protein